jgi:hypothetical protein
MREDITRDVEAYQGRRCAGRCGVDVCEIQHLVDRIEMDSASFTNMRDATVRKQPAVQQVGKALSLIKFTS